MSETQNTAPNLKPRETEFHLKIDSLPGGALSIEGQVILGPPPPRDPSKDLQMAELLQAIIPSVAHAIMQMGEAKRKASQQAQRQPGEVHVGPWPGSGDEPRNGAGRTHAEQVAFEQAQGQGADDEEEEDDLPEPIV